MAAKDSNGWLVIVDPNRRYLREGDRDRVRFTYLHDGWSESKSAQWSSTAVLGRSEPIRGYMASGPRVIQLQLAIPPEADNFPEAPYTRSRVLPISSRIQRPPARFTTAGEAAQIAAQQSGGLTISTTVFGQSEEYTTNYFYQKWRVLDFIRSLVYPEYGSKTDIIYPPPRVLVIFGTWFSLLGICTSWNMTHRGPFDSGDPLIADQYESFGGSADPAMRRGTMTPYYTEVSLTIEEADEPYSWREVYEGILRIGGSEKKFGSLSSVTGI